jgi:hypothetical protein
MRASHTRKRQHGDLRTGAADETRQRGPLDRQHRQARLACERDHQRHAVDGEQDAQDRTEIAKIRQCG